MKHILIISVVSLISFSSCNSKKGTVVKAQEPCVPSTEENCVCATNYDPVCGCDNKTYYNECHAKCSNVTYVAGKCKDKK